MAEDSGKQYGVDAKSVRSVDQIMKELNEQHKNSAQKWTKKLFSGTSDGLMSNALEKEDVSDVVGKKDASKDDNDKDSIVDTVKGAVTSKMNPRSFFKTAATSFVMGGAGGVGSSLIQGIFNNQNQQHTAEPSTDAARKDSKSVGISVAEYAQQADMIAKNHEAGRDTKYLKITENQWNGLNDYQKATVVGTIFMDTNIPETDEYKEYVQKMNYGEFVNIMTPEMPGGAKELMSLRDEQLEAIDEIVEGDNVVDKDGNAVSFEDDTPEPVVEQDAPSTGGSEIEAEDTAISDEARIAEQRALVEDGGPDIIEDTMNDDYGFGLK